MKRAVLVGSALWRPVLAALVVFAPLTQAAEPASVTGEADGIFAELRVDGAGTDIGWRFLHRPPAPIERIDATLNGRPLGAPPDTLAPFPAPGQSAALLCLIDDGGGTDRAAAIRTATSAAAALPAALPQGVSVSVATFDGGSPPATQDPGGEAPAPVAAVAPMQGDLASAVRQGIDQLGGRPASRRALLVFTDGFARGPLPVDDLAAAALSRAVAVFFVLTPSMRLADVANLGRLAQASRGGLIDPAADLAAALSRTILSGSQLRFPFGPAVRYFWEPHARVGATLGYGSRRLELSLDADLPAAGWAQTARALGERSAPRLPAFAAGACVGLLGWIIMRLLRPPRRPA